MSLLRRTWRVLLWRFQRVQAVQLTTVVYFAFACRQLARILSSGSLPRSICWQTSVTDCPVSNTHLLKKNAIFAFQFKVEGSRIIRLSSAWIRVCHFFYFRKFGIKVTLLQNGAKGNALEIKKKNCVCHRPNVECKKITEHCLEYWIQNIKQLFIFFLEV